MDTIELNKSLANLETNLRNLKSARDQVEIVTESTDNLVNSTEKLLTEIKQLSLSFDNGFSGSEVQLSAILDNFDKKILSGALFGFNKSMPNRRLSKSVFSNL